MAELPKRTSVKKEEVLLAIPGSCGQLYPIELALNCTRSAVKAILETFPDVKQELEDEKERELDKIIMTAVEDAKSGDSKAKAKAQEMLLKAMARDRGFGERLEVTGAGGQPLVFLHTAPKMLSRDEWVQRADRYAENEDHVIDAEIAKLGIDGRTAPKLPEKTYGKTEKNN